MSKHAAVSLKTLAKEIGKSEAYFYAMRKTQPEHFNFIFGRDPHPRQALMQYSLYVNQLKNNIGDFLNTFDNGKQSCKYFRASGLPYSGVNTSAFLMHLSNVVYGIDNEFDIRGPRLHQLENIWTYIQNHKE